MADAEECGHVFVDGNNLMGARPDGWWRDRRRAQRRIVAEIAAIAEADSGAQWTVVFDGAPDRGRPADGALRVEFAARRGRNAADDRIVELLGALPDGERALVYTSDRELRERASALGARVEGVGALLRRIEREG